MDLTPKEDDSGHVSSSMSLDAVFKSTPQNENESTPKLCSSNLKKRKFCDIRSRRLDDLSEVCSSTPQASSTLNESLRRKFEDIQIEADVSYCDGPARKLLKTEELVTPPSTPEPYLSRFECTPKKNGIYPISSSVCSVPSPLKEQHDILYPNLKPLDPFKRSFSSQKFRDKLETAAQYSTPCKKVLEDSPAKKLLNKILTNDIIMGHIFKYLSNGELFRLSMVSTGFRDALYRSTKASQRYNIYRDCHRINKENYKITPRNSPESSEVFEDGSLSPDSRKFADFVETGKALNANQSLIKCPQCGTPSVVENSIAQCQKTHSCGYIFCQKCNSCAFNPEEFYDKCQNLALQSSEAKIRQRLEDLTNASPDFSTSSVWNSTANYQYQSSGYFSGCDSSAISVKRNLSMSFGVTQSNNASKSQRALFDSNRSTTSVTHKPAKRRLSGYVKPETKTGSLRKKIEVVEPSSPPKGKTYSVCSKESRRSLKRLTR